MVPPDVPQKPDTSAGFEPTFQLGPEVLASARESMRRDGQLDTGPLSPRIHRFLLDWARLRNVHSSARLEGNPLELADARQVLHTGQSGTTDEEELLRLVRAYDRVQQAAQFAPMTIPEILTLHKDLFDGVLPDRMRPGHLKDVPNGIVDGTTGIWIFQATPPDRTEAELQRLLDWFYGEAQRLDPVVACGLFFCEFQSIHPFLDGNGRIGRILNLRLLRASGLQNVTLTGFDGLIFRHREQYYDSLRATNLGRNYHIWLRFYAKTLARAYRDAQRRGDLGAQFGEITAASERAVLEWTLSSGVEWFQRADFPNPDGLAAVTVSTALAALHERGILERRGDKRTARYRLSDKFLKGLYERTTDPDDDRFD